MKEERKLQGQILIFDDLVFQDVCYFSNCTFLGEYAQNKQKARAGRLNMHAMIFQLLEMIVCSNNIWKTSGHLKESGPFRNLIADHLVFKQSLYISVLQKFLLKWLSIQTVV